MEKIKVRVKLEQVIELVIDTKGLNIAQATEKALHLVKEEGEGNMVSEASTVMFVSTGE